jgi:Tol biopolymer transport system component
LFSFVVEGAALVWAPDSRHLLFRGRRIDNPKSTDWWVAPIESGEPVRTHAIENLALTDIVQFPAGWVGNNVYYASGTTIEGINLHRARINPKTLAITGPAETITTGPGMKYFPAIMTDGRVFFAEMRVAMNAWSVAARTDEAVVSAKPERLTQDIMQNFTPAISRDGTKAAYMAFGGVRTAKVEVRVKDLRTGEETRIPARGMKLFQYPRLSPSGSLLAYVDAIEGKNKTLIFAPGAAAGRELCEGCLVFGFSSDDRFALICTKPNELETMDLRTGQKTVALSSPRDIIEGADLSSDGKWLVWLAGEPDGRAAVRVSPVDGRRTGSPSPITIAEASYYLGSPAWSPNGRWVYYLSERNGRASLFARELDPRTKNPAGPEREILPTVENRLNLNFPKGNGTIGVAKDRIVFEATAMTGNIYMAKPRKR